MSKTTFDPLKFRPIYIGPTWKRDADGDWVLPQYSLGWGVIAWCTEWLTNDEGLPWRFTLEQVRFVLWLYAIDSAGRFVYRDAVLQRCKGWGKDPLAAVIALAELMGPCRFSHWDNGLPVGKDNPAAWIQMAAVSFEQNKNTMLLIPTMLPDRTRQKYQMEVGKEKIRSHGSRRLLEAITSAARSAEGNRPSFFIGNETHHFLSSNGGHDMWDVVERNATKSKGGATRRLAITNAFQPGEDSVAERSREAYDKSVSINPLTGMPYVEDFGLLYDSIEAPPDAPLTAEAARVVLKHIRGDAVWLDIDTIVKSIIDIRNPPSRSRRFWYNQIVSDEETLISRSEWDSISRPVAQLADKDEIVLGFDGSKNKDATALIAIRIRDRMIFPLGIWQREKSPSKDHLAWEVDRLAVDGAVDNAFARFKVRAFFADVYQWESYIDNWSDRYRGELAILATPGKSAIGFDMRGHQEDLTKANERLVASVLDKQYHHNGDARLAAHVRATRGVTNKWGLYFTKTSREGGDPNDGYAALLLASHALTKFVESGRKPERQRTGRVHML